MKRGIDLFLLIEMHILIFHDVYDFGDSLSYEMQII